MEKYNINPGISIAYFMLKLNIYSKLCHSHKSDRAQLHGQGIFVGFVNVVFIVTIILLISSSSDKEAITIPKARVAKV